MLSILMEENFQDGEYIRRQLINYAQKIDNLLFDAALVHIESCKTKVSNEEACAPASDKTGMLDKLYVLSIYLLMLEYYAEFWKEVIDKKFPRSWNLLQETITTLRVVKKFSGQHEGFYLGLIEKQVTAIEKLYPYKFFMSIEAITEGAECSICGKEIDSLECEHIAGELYNGQMACRIIKEIKKVPSVSIVTSPADKGCIIQPMDNGSLSFRMVEFLADTVISRQMNPWEFGGIEETTTRETVSKFNKVGRNDKCPCGSNKKFKKCCLGKGQVEILRTNLVVNKGQYPVL